jgi:hypothetical protein
VQLDKIRPNTRYRSYITGRGSPLDLRVNLADQDTLLRLMPQDIVIYPEIISGNPLKGKRVVRYLLNKPGRTGKATLEDYGKDDYFLHFVGEFRPEGVASRLLWIPLVDKSIYCSESQLEPRMGFVLFSHRREFGPGASARLGVARHAGFLERATHASGARQTVPREPCVDRRRTDGCHQ